jgi:hypothetical protein
MGVAELAATGMTFDTQGQPLPRTNCMIAALTSGVRRCQLATSSRSVASSRHSSDMPAGQFSQTVCEKQFSSNELRVQFPPPPLEGTCESSQVPSLIEFASFHSRVPGTPYRIRGHHTDSGDTIPGTPGFRGHHIEFGGTIPIPGTPGASRCQRCFWFWPLSEIPDRSEVPIRVGLHDQRATEARSRFFACERGRQSNRTLAPRRSAQESPAVV